MKPSTDSMHCWFVTSNATSVSLQLRKVPVPKPGKQQILVRIRAAGLNRGEFVPGHGLHASASARPAGFEAAGDVVVRGEEVETFSVGDRVFGRCDGGLAQFGCMNESEAFRVPQHLSWEEAASIPVVFSTAHDMLMGRQRIAPGEWLLIAGAASGVGVASLALAKAVGAKVIGSSGSAAKLERLKALGLDVAVQTRSGDFGAAVMEATEGRGVDWAVNAIGGSVVPACLRALGFEGRLVIVGYVDGVLHPAIDLMELHKNRLHVFGVSQKLRSGADRAKAALAFGRDVMPLIAEGRARTLVDRVFGFDEVLAAQAYLDEDRHVGKVVVQVAGE